MRVYVRHTQLNSIHHEMGQSALSNCVADMLVHCQPDSPFVPVTSHTCLVCTTSQLGQVDISTEVTKHTVNSDTCKQMSIALILRAVTMEHALI